VGMIPLSRDERECWDAGSPSAPWDGAAGPKGLLSLQAGQTARSNSHSSAPGCKETLRVCPNMDAVLAERAAGQPRAGEPRVPASAAGTGSPA